jgi:hypothetical protein
MADMLEHPAGTVDTGNEEERRRRFVKPLILTAIAVALPATALLLWLLSAVQMWPQAADIMGLLAVSVGILGILLFFMFLYKYQMTAVAPDRRRWILLLVHAAVTLTLFLFMIWLGYDSPWSRRMIWGNYDLLSAAKPWIISVLVIGSITMLGSMIDLIRRRLERRWKDG